MAKFTVKYILWLDNELGQAAKDFKRRWFSTSMSQLHSVI